MKHENNTIYSQSFDLDTLVNAVTKGFEFTAEDAGQIIIDNNIVYGWGHVVEVSGDNYVPVTIRKGQYVGDELIIVYKSTISGYSDAYGTQSAYNLGLHITIDGGHKFETDNEQIPVEHGNLVMGWTHFSKLQLKQIEGDAGADKYDDRVVFLKWVGNTWLITNVTIREYFKTQYAAYPYMYPVLLKP